MLQFKSKSNILYLTNPDIYELVQNSPYRMAEEMAKELVMVSSGFFFSMRAIQIELMENKYPEIIFIYPKGKLTVDSVSNELYLKIREYILSGKLQGMDYRMFNYSVREVHADETDLNQEFIGLVISTL